jgi:hypothetical protein
MTKHSGKIDDGESTTCPKNLIVVEIVDSQCRIAAFDDH